VSHFTKPNFKLCPKQHKNLSCVTYQTHLFVTDLFKKNVEDVKIEFPT